MNEYRAGQRVKVTNPFNGAERFRDKIVTLVQHDSSTFAEIKWWWVEESNYPLSEEEFEPLED